MSAKKKAASRASSVVKKTKQKSSRVKKTRPSEEGVQGYPGLIGVIHLPALAGAPRAIGEDPVEILQNAGLLALEEARMLEDAGFDALILENFGDIPFYLDQVPPETVAALSVISAAVKEAVRIPVGLNVLRNDARSALAIAAVNGLEFIRVNVLSGVAATDQGWAVGGAAALLRERDRLHAGVAIFADVAVKHAINYSARSVGLAVEEVVERAGADAAIVTGPTTGRGVDLNVLKEAAQACRAIGAPLYVGSGASVESLSELLSEATGVIVGSAIRKGGQAGAPLDQKRIQQFVSEFRRVKKKSLKKRKVG